jgi:hypothetical protein
MRIVSPFKSITPDPDDESLAQELLKVRQGMIPQG